MIVVYDSGLGGLTVLGALRRAGVADDVLYFADQAHVPYGDRTDDDLARLLTVNLRWLREQGVDLVVMGCNTSCAVAARRGWPDVPFPGGIVGLIEHGAAAVAAGAYRNVAVLATAATVRSGAYGRAILAAAPAATVVEVAAPALVPIVEAGEAHGERARAAVAALAADLPTGVDAIVYGCTHYPLLDAHVAALLPGAARIDPALAQARSVAAAARHDGAGRTTYVTTGDVAAFERNVRAWTGDRVGDVVGLVVR